VSLSINGDTVLEDYEQFTFRLSTPAGATVGNASEAVQIRNDETPKLALAAVKVAEGQPAVFRPKLAQAYFQPVALTEQTLDGTAVSPGDYAAVAASVVVPAGSKLAPVVSVGTVADGVTEPTEVFSLKVSSPTVVAAQTRTASVIGDLCRNAAPPTHYRHVVVVVMENKHYADVIGDPGAPWTTKIARGCATAKSYAQVATPSRPNYLALAAGSTFDCAGSDADPVIGTCNPTSGSLFKQVIDGGGTAISYAEAMTGNCDMTSHGTYAVKHNPWPYFAAERSLCQQYDQPMPAGVDVANLPSLLLMIPDLCNDTHNCPVGTGDAWLAAHLQPVFDSPAYLDGSTAVIVTYDEYTNVPNVFASASVEEGVSAGGATSHYGLLRTIDDLLGLTPLGQAAAAASLRAAMHL
jgi:acid phosphatase